MPETRTERIVFGVLMSMTMALGMEVYNIACKMGFNTMPGGFSNMTNEVFPAALLEAAYMWILSFSSPICGATGSVMPWRSGSSGRDRTIPSSSR